jgi:hypothetical protein
VRRRFCAAQSTEVRISSRSVGARDEFLSIAKRGAPPTISLRIEAGPALPPGRPPLSSEAVRRLGLEIGDRSRTGEVHKMSPKGLIGTRPAHPEPPARPPAPRAHRPEPAMPSFPPAVHFAWTTPRTEFGPTGINGLVAQSVAQDATATEHRDGRSKRSTGLVRISSGG